MRIAPYAIIGVVDIVSSTEISNKINAQTDWDLKARFFELAKIHADETGMTILNHFGDGFLFWANPNDNLILAANLIRFFEGLTFDFKKLLKGLEPELKNLQSGLRVGVAAGPIAIGPHPSAAQNWLVAGADVNLAARLCSSAEVDEMVVSSRVWYAIKHALGKRSQSIKNYDNFKGFDTHIPAVHIALNDAYAKNKSCFQADKFVTQESFFKQDLVDRLLREFQFDTPRDETTIKCNVSKTQTIA